MVKVFAASVAAVFAVAGFVSLADASTVLRPAASAWRYANTATEGDGLYRQAMVLDGFVTCKEAGMNLMADGWRKVRIKSCKGFNYYFSAVRGSIPGIVRVDGRSGQIVSVRWLPYSGMTFHGKVIPL